VVGAVPPAPPDPDWPPAPADPLDPPVLVDPAAPPGPPASAAPPTPPDPDRPPAPADPLDPPVLVAPAAPPGPPAPAAPPAPPAPVAPAEPLDPPAALAPAEPLVPPALVAPAAPPPASSAPAEPPDPPREVVVGLLTPPLEHAARASAKQIPAVRVVILHTWPDHASKWSRFLRIRWSRRTLCRQRHERWSLPPQNRTDQQVAVRRRNARGLGHAVRFGRVGQRHARQMST
jgi:hypothetical protein